MGEGLTATPAKKRIVWYDVARFFAIISISLNHAVNRAFSIGNAQYEVFKTESTAATLFAAIIQIISRLGVPIFLMLTGALILNKEFKDKEDVGRFYKHNLLPLFITTEIWLFLMSFQMTLSNMIIQKNISIGSIADSLKKIVYTMLFINQKTAGSMWYMPMILGIYTFIPLIAIAINKIPGKMILVSCALVFIGHYLFPEINFLMLQIGNTKRLSFAFETLNLFSPYMLYLLAGYFINKGLLSKLNNFTAVIITLLFFALGCGYQYWSFLRPADYVLRYNSVFVLFASVGLFDLFRRFCNKEIKLTPFISYMSRISFGIYFLHICIMSVLRYYCDKGVIVMSRTMTLIFYEVVSVGASIVIIWLLSKIKVFKKYVFLIK